MAKRAAKSIECIEDLLKSDYEVDKSVCGVELIDPGATKIGSTGAHDPTPTPYFVLEELFGYFDFDYDSHLLDVGCGLGRPLAHFARMGALGRATGIELDGELASFAQQWATRHDQLNVLQGDALELDLSQFTDFYLFNPFETTLLFKFISKVEAEVTRPITLVHMSDNGETYYYIGRPGWSNVAYGWVDKYQNERGRSFYFYDQAQHYSVWRFDPSAA